MTLGELKLFLNQIDISFEEKSIDYGTQLRCKPGGEVFNVFHSGKIVVQGNRESSLSKSVGSWLDSGIRPTDVLSSPPSIDRITNRDVFIVHGHDITARNALELEIRRFGLNPIIIQNLPSGGDTIIEKLERYLGERGDIGYACVILTPDDQGHKAAMPESIKYRARQNVVLELGMVLAKLGRRRVAILHKESIELPSDIAGLIYIPYQESIEEIKDKLHGELREAGLLAL